ncbi:hypothetical protein [Agarilytica rhodophyticola]|uniref:hypothetical protein n=1 Tax=Agarilytica rhodophyticola TaxID=1737490 RepID=UPI000B348145|nr:hypothetical protein [Agarilytica rhodophyticola]
MTLHTPAFAGSYAMNPLSNSFGIARENRDERQPSFFVGARATAPAILDARNHSPVQQQTSLLDARSSVMPHESASLLDHESTHINGKDIIFVGRDNSLSALRAQHKNQIDSAIRHAGVTSTLITDAFNSYDDRTAKMRLNTLKNEIRQIDSIPREAMTSKQKDKLETLKLKRDNMQRALD